MLTTRAAVVAAGVTVASLLAAPSAAGDDDKYTQTWPTPYEKTTCAQFLGQMTSKQRWVMAADMLTNARNVKRKTGLPSDDLITEFEGGLRNVCVIDSMNMADAGTGLYLTEPRFQP